MKKMLALLGAATAMTMAAAPASAVTVLVPIGSSATTATYSDYFMVTYPHTPVTPSTPFITANYGATQDGANTPFDFKFTFMTGLSGKGSGSLSTSFSTSDSFIQVNKVIINGASYFPVPAVPTTPGGQTLVVSGIPITAFAGDYFEVIGTTGASTIAGTFDGTVTFKASPTVPEPTTWAMFLAGFGFMGVAARRKLAGQFKTA